MMVQVQQHFQSASGKFERDGFKIVLATFKGSLGCAHHPQRNDAMTLRNQNMEAYNTEVEGLAAVNLLLSSMYPLRSIEDMRVSKILQDLKAEILAKWETDNAEWASIAN